MIEVLFNIKPIRTKAYDELLNWLRTFKRFRIKCCLVCGDLGVGKTFTINTVAKTLGYSVIYITHDQVENLESIISSPSSLLGEKRLVHIDRPYSELKFSSRYLRKICEISTIPVIIEDETRNYKYYGSIMCHKIRVEPPSLYPIANIIKAHAIVKPNFNLVSQDIRQSILLAFGSRPQSQEEWIRFVKDLLSGRNPRNLERSHLPIIIDNLNAFYGIDLINLIDILTYVDKILTLTSNNYFNNYDYEINVETGDIGVSESFNHVDLSVFLSKIKPIKMTKQIENYFYPKLRKVREMEELG